MRQIEHKDFSVAGYLGMIEVALVRVVLLRLPGPLNVFVLHQGKREGSLNCLILGHCKAFNCQSRVLRLALIIFTLHVHREAIDVFAVRKKGCCSHSTAWPLGILLFVFLFLVTLIFLALKSELLL